MLRMCEPVSESVRRLNEGGVRQGYGESATDSSAVW